MFKRTKVPVFGGIFFAIIVLSGCSASKQVYHDITARNNAFFNGEQKLKTIQKTIADSYKDNFDTLLTLRPERVPEMTKTYGSEMDEVVKKASYAIKRHEQSKWTDDSYLLVGKAYYMKGNYDAALEAFKYINTEFKDEVKKSDKKKEQKKKKKKKKSSKKKKKKKSSSKKKLPVKSDVKTATQPGGIYAQKPEEKKKQPAFAFLRRTPVRPQALVWMVDTYTELEKFKEADAVITIIEADENFPRKLKKDLALAKAHLAIRRGSPERAIQPLGQAITLSKKKKFRSRYYYVLGQIYEKDKQYSSSTENYRKVLKNRPKFDMEFNAKLSIARVAGYDQSMSSGEITRLLTQLLKDRKNKDFYDRIYYSLAELELSRGSKKEAIKYLEKSAAASTTNTEQKAKSFLRLADIYYDDEKYVEAQQYYDSTTAILPTDFPAYDAVQTRNEILKELVAQMKVVEEQDSLIYIASLSENEREKIIDEIIRQKEKAKADNDTTGINNSTQLQDDKKKTDTSTNSASSWYFYNVNAKTSGYNNFIKKWGARKLEDNWRRNNKSSNASSDDEEEKDEDDSATSSVKLSDENLDKSSLLEAIPLTNEQLEKSNKLIGEALYTMGNLYRVELKNRKKAIEAFEELVKRFPDNEHLPETYYNLYILHREEGSQGKAEQYRSLLLNKFPESTFAKYIINPELLEEDKMKERLLNDYYSQIYTMYLENRLDEALLAIRKSDSLFPGNPLRPKFALLKAQVIGKTKDLPKYLEALQAVLDNHPTTEERKKAEEIITYLEVSQDSTYQMQVNISEYKYDAEAIHFFLVEFNSDSVSSADLTNDIASYNDVNRSLEDLKINAVSLDEKKTFLVVKSFKNLKAAVNYYNLIKASESTFSKYPAGSLQFCVISDVNFNKVIINREIESYFKFFEARYVTN